MHLTQFTDYSLRVLIYLGLKQDMATVGEIAEAFEISRNHLVKVAHHLAREGFIESFKGKHGGLKLTVDPKTIRIGDIVNQLEPMSIVECFEKDHNTCPIAGICHLEKNLKEAQKAFVDSLNKYTLADYLKSGPGRTLRLQRLGISS